MAGAEVPRWDAFCRSMVRDFAVEDDERPGPVIRASFCRRLSLLKRDEFEEAEVFPSDVLLVELKPMADCLLVLGIPSHLVLTLGMSVGSFEVDIMDMPAPILVFFLPDDPCCLRSCSSYRCNALAEGSWTENRLDKQDFFSDGSFVFDETAKPGGGCILIMEFLIPRMLRRLPVPEVPALACR